MNTDSEIAAYRAAFEEIERFGRVLGRAEREEVAYLEGLLELEYDGTETALRALGEIVPIDRRVQGRRDGRREREIHLGHRRRQHVRRVAVPLQTAPSVQPVQRRYPQVDPLHVRPG